MRTGNLAAYSFKVSELFLGRLLDHLSGIARALSPPEPELALNVSASVLENKN